MRWGLPTAAYVSALDEDKNRKSIARPTDLANYAINVKIASEEEHSYDDHEHFAS